MAGKVHTFPTGARCEQHRILRLLELMDDFLRMPPYFHKRKGQSIFHLIVDSAHEGIGSKKRQSVPVRGFHYSAAKTLLGTIPKQSSAASITDSSRFRCFFIQFSLFVKYKKPPQD